jgi:hypothetical protein
METGATIQEQPEARTIEEDWAEAEWFTEWLRLARREYQGCPDVRPEMREAA